MAVPDEPSHVIKAAAVVRGEWLGRRVRVVQAGNVVTTQFQVLVPAAIASLPAVPGCFAFHPSVPAGCAPSIGDRTTLQMGSTTAGAYPPVYYLAVGWPSRILGPRAAIYVMRLCSVVLAAAFLATAWTSARRLTRSPWLVIGFALALTPMAFFLAGSVNPSGVEIAAAVATWLTLLELLCQRGRTSSKLIVWAALSAVAFAAVRPLGSLLCVATIATVVAIAGTRERLVELWSERRVRGATAAMALALVGTAAWTVLARESSALAGAPVPGLTLTSAIRHSLNALPGLGYQMVGNFGWLDTPLPHWLLWAWAGAVLFLGAIALIVGTWRQRVVLVAATAATVVLTALGNALMTTRAAGGWQGRYSLPLAVGVVVLAGWMLAERGPQARSVRAAVAVTAGGVAGGQLVAETVAINRNVVGVPRALPVYVHGHGWSPPLSVATMLALAIVVFGCYGVWLLASAMAVAPSRASRPYMAHRRRP
jgi:hypothetical protein